MTGHTTPYRAEVEAKLERERARLDEATEEARSFHTSWTADMGYHAARCDAFEEVLELLRGVDA